MDKVRQWLLKNGFEEKEPNRFFTCNRPIQANKPVKEEICVGKNVQYVENTNHYFGTLTRALQVNLV